MKRLSMLLIPAAFAVGVAFNAAPSKAAGCVSGAVMGGAAGHLMGHHTLLGAGAGCLIGRHEANKAARDEAARNEREDRAQEREYGGGDR
jgi:uncharacterized protein YcfJ